MSDDITMTTNCSLNWFVNYLIAIIVSFIFLDAGMRSTAKSCHRRWHIIWCPARSSSAKCPCPCRCPCRCRCRCRRTRCANCRPSMSRITMRPIVEAWLIRYNKYYENKRKKYACFQEKQVWEPIYLFFKQLAKALSSLRMINFKRESRSFGALLYSNFYGLSLKMKFSWIEQLCCCQQQQQ